MKKYSTFIISLLLLLFIGYALVNVARYSNPIKFVKASANFLSVDVSDPTKFSFKSQDVMLKGVNINNVGALGIYQAANINNVESGPGDYEKIASLGANHVRFGMSYQWYLTNPTGFYNMMDNQIQWARQNNLWIIPTLFTLPYLGENTDDSFAHPNGGCYQGYANPCNFWGATQDDRDARTAVKNFWIDFTSHYKDEDTIAGYDLLNEPWSQDETFSRDIYSMDYFIEVINAIVSGGHNDNQLFFIESEPDPLSWVLYESYTSSMANLNALKTLTSNRIVISSHMYSPFNLTHSGGAYPIVYEGVTWNNTTMTNPTSPDPYPGSVVSTLRTGGTVEVNGVTYTTYDDYIADYPNDLRNRFAIAFAQEDLEVPIYIGEWSARQVVALDGTGWLDDSFLDYNSDVANLFDSWGVHDAVFEFKAGENNWGLFKETGPQASHSFSEVVSFNADSPGQTTQPFIDTLSNIWDTVLKPDFVVLAAQTCQNGVIEGTEQCDDANAVNGDGCSSTCNIERSGPTIASTRNICQVQASFSDFRFDGNHIFDVVDYTDPDNVTADVGYPVSNLGLKLGNDGTNYFLPYLWFESVNLANAETVSNAYIDFNLNSTSLASVLDAKVFGLKVGADLRDYDPDGGSADRYYVDRNPYSTYLGGANWTAWSSFSSGSLITPFVGFPHNTLTRSNGAVYQWNRTTANTTWSMPSESLNSGTYYTTPNIASVINELVAQGGWASGNDLGVVLIPGLGTSSSVRSFYGFDADITTGLGTYSYMNTNSDPTKLAKLYAKCVDYISGLNAKNDSFEIDSNEDLNGDIKIDNGSGVDLNPGAYSLTYVLSTDTTHGDLTFNSNGTFSYTPVEDYSGTDWFMYTISDGKGGTDNAVATINIVGNNNPTVIIKITGTGSLITPYTLNADAFDLEGAIASYSWEKFSGPGTVSFSAASSATTNAQFSVAGTYVVKVTVTDSQAASATDIIQIVIAPVVTPTATVTSTVTATPTQTPTVISFPASYVQPTKTVTTPTKVGATYEDLTGFQAETPVNAESSFPFIPILIALIGGGFVFFIVIYNRKKNSEE